MITVSVLLQAAARKASKQTSEAEGSRPKRGTVPLGNTNNNSAAGWSDEDDEPEIIEAADDGDADQVKIKILAGSTLAEMIDDQPGMHRAPHDRQSEVQL